jgi:hypothetical protein
LRGPASERWSHDTAPASPARHKSNLRVLSHTRAAQAPLRGQSANAPGKSRDPGRDGAHTRHAGTKAPRKRSARSSIFRRDAGVSHPRTPVEYFQKGKCQGGAPRRTTSLKWLRKRFPRRRDDLPFAVIGAPPCTAWTESHRKVNDPFRLPFLKYSRRRLPCPPKAAILKKPGCGSAGARGSMPRAHAPPFKVAFRRFRPARTG